MAIEMMKTASRGMCIAMRVEAMGKIVETSAMHHSGRRMTPTGIDFATLSSDEAAPKALVGNKPGSVADTKQLFGLVTGLKIETAPEMAILFRSRPATRPLWL